MRFPAVCALSAVFVAGCGHSMSGPTAPATPQNVAGSWSGNAVDTFTSGPSCLVGRAPATVAATFQITQSGTSLAGTMTIGQGPCTFHGTVSDTAITLTEDAQQTNPACLASYLVACLAQGGISFVDVGGPTTEVTGTVSGTQITASGTATSNILDPSTGKPTGTTQQTVRLTLQRQ
jgi:hypothetical protein